jgi:hypothetical protein
MSMPNSTHGWTTILNSYARLAPYYVMSWEGGIEYKTSGKHSQRNNLPLLTYFIWRCSSKRMAISTRLLFVLSNSLVTMLSWKEWVLFPEAVASF